MTKTKSLADRIRHLSPCSEAMDWLETQKSALAAWRNCERGDWMLWLIGKTVGGEPWSDERKPILACCLDCAETVKHLWPEKQREQIAAAVITLRKFVAGEATADEAKEAWRAAYAAADAANAAANAAAYAAYAAYAAADAAYAAAYAAANAADAAANAAANAAARKETLALCADIVRRHYPKPPKVTR